nr:hypothetical protein CFP56_24004 [Quercus suber]
MPEGVDFGLGHLDHMIGRGAMLSDDRRYCVMMLDELKQMYRDAAGPRGLLTLSSVLRFPKQDPGPFLLLVRRRVPQALVVLAYYCVLLDQLNQRWWIDKWASRVLQEIVQTVNEQWQGWIAWPVGPAVPNEHANHESGVCGMRLEVEYLCRDACIQWPGAAAFMRGSASRHARPAFDMR